MAAVAFGDSDDVAFIQSFLFAAVKDKPLFLYVTAQAWIWLRKLEIDHRLSCPTMTTTSTTTIGVLFLATMIDAFRS